LYTDGTTLKFTVDGDATQASGTIAANTVYIVSALHNQGASPKTKLYINGAVQGDTADANRSSEEYDGHVGGIADGAELLDGKLYELGVISRSIAILDAERRTIEAMLAERYGVTLS
jgi:hypothetical protein